MFTQLPHFTGDAWQGGTQLPDPVRSWARLHNSGGHPGDSPKLAAIRRWTAPVSGAVAIEGRLGHDQQAGDGVRARIVSSAHCLVAEWSAHQTKVETRVDRLEVRQGDTVDFVVDRRHSIDSDSFTWAPIIRLVSDGSPTTAAPPREWNAKADFQGPPPRPLDAWEQYAQVLLLSNELIFVD